MLFAETEFESSQEHHPVHVRAHSAHAWGKNDEFPKVSTPYRFLETGVPVLLDGLMRPNLRGPKDVFLAPRFAHLETGSNA